MHISIFAFLNLVFLLMHAFGHFFVLKSGKPKLKAFTGVLLTGFFIIYVLTLAIACKKHSAPLLLVFLAIPFLIGKKVKYKTLGMYSTLQLLALVGSFAYLIYLK